jgi:hypothetical protein
MNEEFLVSASHQLALITSLPFVHTARRYYRLNGLVRPLDGAPAARQGEPEIVQTYPFRGSKSRNKVSVGEPAEGSLTNSKTLVFDCIVLRSVTLSGGVPTWAISQGVCLDVCNAVYLQHTTLTLTY